MSVMPKHRGARNELQAMIWLFDQGFEVFRNVSANGLIDIIAKRGDEILFLDVKTASHNLSYEQMRAGVQALICHRDGSCEIVLGVAPEIPCRKCGRPIPRRWKRDYCSQACATSAVNS